MAKKIFDAVATVGKYTNKNGEEKKRYMNVGSVFEDDQGRMSLKLEGLPIGGEWNGWVSFFSQKEQAKPAKSNAGDFPDPDLDIPF